MSATDLPQDLADLARAWSHVDRRQAALDPMTDPDMLARLVRDESLVIVGYAAGHPSTRPEDLLVAVRAVNRAIKENEALWHPSSSVVELMAMGKDNPIPVVQHILARNPNTPAEALRELGQSLRTPIWLMRGIAAHPNCPVDLLEAYAEGSVQRKFYEFQMGNLLSDVLHSDNCPPELAEEHVQHESPAIAHAARARVSA